MLMSLKEDLLQLTQADLHVFYQRIFSQQSKGN